MPFYSRVLRVDVATIDLPVITVDLPTTTSITEGNPFSINATATDADSWSLLIWNVSQWVATGTSGSGGSASFTSPSNGVDGGLYDNDQYRFRFTNGGGYVDTTSTTILVGAYVAPPVVTVDLPSTTEVDNDNPFTLAATATGADSWTFWYWTGSAWAETAYTGSGGSASYTSESNAFDGGAYDGNQYLVRFTNAGGYTETTSTTIDVLASGIADNFNRSNNADPAVSQPSGITWDEFYQNGVDDSAWTIASNALTHTTTDFTTLVNTTALASANHWAEVYVPTGLGVGTIAAGPAVRLNAAGTQGYIASAWSDRIRIYKLNSALTILTDIGSGTNFSGKTIKMEASGNILSIYSDGVLVDTHTDTSYPSNTRVGINGKNVAGVDDFQGGVL